MGGFKTCDVCGCEQRTFVGRPFCGKHQRLFKQYGDATLTVQQRIAMAGRKRSATLRANPERYQHIREKLNQARFVERIERICPECNSGFLVRPKERKKYCSDECVKKVLGRLAGARQSAKKTVQEYVCEWCKTPFTGTGKIRKRRFCFLKCRAEWQSSLPYSEWRGKLSASRTGKLLGKDNHAWGRAPGHGRWYNYTDLLGNSYKFRSSYELIVAVYFDISGIRWEYEKYRFDFGDQTYLPDFWLPDADAFWEVKGWFKGKDHCKIVKFRECFPEKNLVVVTDPVMKDISRQLGYKSFYMLHKHVRETMLTIPKNLD